MRKEIGRVGKVVNRRFDSLVELVEGGVGGACITDDRLGFNLVKGSFVRKVGLKEGGMSQIQVGNRRIGGKIRLSAYRTAFLRCVLALTLNLGTPESEKRQIE